MCTNLHVYICGHTYTDICIHVCICEHMYTHLHAAAHIHLCHHTQRYTYAHIYMHTRLQIVSSLIYMYTLCIYANKHLYVCMHLQQTSVFTNLHALVSMHSHMPLPVHVYVHMCMHTHCGSLNKNGPLGSYI